MKICPKCNSECNDEAMFCQQCGSALVAKPEPAKEEFNGEVNQSEEMKHEDFAGEKEFVATTMPEPKERKKLLSKANLFSREGRRARKEYFLISVFWAIFFMVFSFIFSAIGLSDKIGDTIIAIASLYPSYCNNVMRLHDLNKDHAWAVVILVAGLASNFSIVFIGSVLPSAILFTACLIVGLYMLFVKGTDGPNKYGEDPLR